MKKETADRINKVLIENPDLHARVVEVLGEIYNKAGAFDGGDVTEAIKVGKDLLQKHTAENTAAKGLSSAGQEFHDHYMR